MKQNIAIIIFICLLTMISTSEAQTYKQISYVPATPYPIKMVQPNGDTIKIRIFGDEWHSYYTTLDGYLIVQNQDGYYCYAKFDKNDSIVPSKYILKGKNKKLNWCEKKHLKKMLRSKILKKNINQ